MFCDLVGSTGLSARLDPEDMRDLIGAYRKSIVDAVALFDGFVAQYLGDGVLVYFGYPQAHEDDAERAIRAGLAALAAIDAIQGQAAPLKARIGIATGPVVVGEQMGAANSQERIAIGETPNLAALLQSVAAPGEVVIAASTRRLVGRMFDDRALGPMELKGLSRPVEAWQVRGEAVGVSRFEARRAATFSPLVGREEEIDLLRRRWQQAKGGEGRVVLLSGDAGIGKSRIVESLLAELEAEPRARLRYFCSPHHAHSPLHPFIAQLEQAAGFAPDSDAAAKRDKLTALLALHARNAPDDVALIAELMGMPPDQRYPTVQASPPQKREMTLTALLRQLDGIAARNPVLIVFEDAHWIDPTSLDLLDRTVAHIAELPVLLLVTFRPEFQPAWIGQPHVTMLPLSRLGRRDSANLIAGVTKGKTLPDTVVQQILSHTDGVPLFIEELTSSLLESGTMRETADAYLLDRPLPPLAIPTTLRASLVARLDRLGPDKEVAQIGAAIGREFAHELIAAVASLPPEALDAALGRLTGAGLISRRGAPPAATYAFKHALVQDAAYAAVLRTRRRQLHASIAQALVARFPTVAEREPAIVAHHFTEAGLPDEAVGYWRTAGQIATARSANREAASSFERALSLLAALPESQTTLEQAVDTRLALRGVLAQLGEFLTARDRMREAAALAERLDDVYRRGRTLSLITNIHSNLGDLDEAFRTGSHALEIATRLGDLRLRIPTTTYLEQVHYYRGDYARVVALASDNLAALPADWGHEHFGMSAPASVFDRYWLIMSLAQLGRFAEAAAQEAAAMRLAEPTQHAFTVGSAAFAASTLLLLKGDWVQARAQLERTIATFRAGAVGAQLPYPIALSAWAAAQLGEASEAMNRIQEGERLLKGHGARGIVSLRGWCYHALGRATLLLGQSDAAKAFAEQAIECSTGHHGFAAHARHLLGDIAAQDDVTAAEDHYRQATALAEPRGMGPLIAHCQLGLGRVYQRAGKGESASPHLTAAASMYRDMDMKFWLQQADAATRAAV